MLGENLLDAARQPVVWSDRRRHHRRAGEFHGARARRAARRGARDRGAGDDRRPRGAPARAREPESAPRRSRTRAVHRRRSARSGCATTSRSTAGWKPGARRDVHPLPRSGSPHLRGACGRRMRPCAIRSVTLRELFALLGEQGLLVFCGVLAAPFLLPVTVPAMSTVFGDPDAADRLRRDAVARALAAGAAARSRHQVRTVRTVLARARGWALRFEHLVRPRLLVLSQGPTINFVNGGILVARRGPADGAAARSCPSPTRCRRSRSCCCASAWPSATGPSSRSAGWQRWCALAYVGGLLVLVFYVGLQSREGIRPLIADRLGSPLSVNRSP